MSFSEQWKATLSAESDYTAKISHDNLFRWWVSVFSLLVAFLLWGGDYIKSIGPIIALFLAYNLTQGISWIFIRFNRASEPLDLALHAIDNIAITASIHWTGGAASSFCFLYIIPVIIEAYHKNLKGLIFNGALGLGLYAGLVFGLERTADPHQMIDLLARITFLAVFSAVAGVSVGLLRKKEECLHKNLIEQQTVARIHQLVNDLSSRRDFEAFAKSIASELTQTIKEPFWHAQVWILSEETGHMVPHGENPGALQNIQHLPSQACPAFRSKAMFQLPRASQDRACSTEQFNYGSHICLPISTKKETYGVLFVGSPQEDAFAAEDVHFLDFVAKTIGSGFERTTELEELQFSYEVGSRALAAFLSSTKGMDETISAILDGVVKILNVDRANVMLWEPELEVLQTRWFRGTPPPPVGRITLKMGEGIAGTALKYNQPYWASDVGQDPNFVSSTGRIRSLLAMPMQTSDGKPLGVINALTLERPRHFSRRDVDFLGLFARQAALAIENALLHEQGIRTIGRLQELDQIKSEFLSRVGHELRGPLTAIQGFSEVLASQMNGELNPKQFELLEQVQQETKIQLRMVEDLLEFGSIERGAWSINKSSCFIPEILGDEFEKAKLFAKAQGIKMMLDLPSGPVPMIDADAERLHQAVWNLLHNAIKYTRPGDEIRMVFVVHKDGDFQISIQDTGLGIPPEALGKVFDKFCQVHGEQSKRSGGLGLGLALVKEIVEAHGGHITAQSPGLGKGSTFTFTLPCPRKSQPKAA